MIECGFFSHLICSFISFDEDISNKQAPNRNRHGGHVCDINVAMCKYHALDDAYFPTCNRQSVRRVSNMADGSAVKLGAHGGRLPHRVKSAKITLKLTRL